MQLIAKLDESSTHDESPMMTMAGYMGRIGQWTRFDRKWGKALRKAGLDYYHTHEMASHPFAEKGVGIADSNLMCGFVVRLDRKDYQEVYRRAHWGGKVQPDSMYGLCFRYCLGMALEIGRHEYPANLRLDFIIEAGNQHEGAAREIVQRIKRERRFGAGKYLGTAGPARKKDCYGLQAADALATGAAWYEATPLPEGGVVNVDGASRLSDLRGKSLMKAPIFRMHLDGQVLEQFRDDQFALVAAKKKWGDQRRREIEERRATSSSATSVLGPLDMTERPT